MTKTQIAILWGLAILVLIVFALIGWALARPNVQDESMVAAITRVYLTEQPYSARSMYPRAEQFAKTWQSDAVLSSVSAGWNLARLSDLAQPTNWTFQFFSASTQKIYVVSVNESQVSVVREGLSPYPLSPISVNNWKMDSDEALNLWLNRGGHTFLEAYPQNDISIRLRPSSDCPMEWVVVGLSRSDEHVQMTRLDATNKIVLE